jgi:hypothetical protein
LKYFNEPVLLTDMNERENQAAMRGESISRQNSLHELLDRIRAGQDIPADVAEEAMVSFLVLLSGDDRDGALYALTSLPHIDQELTDGIGDSLMEKEDEIKELSSSLLSSYEALSEVLVERIADCTSGDDKVDYAAQLESVQEAIKNLKAQYNLKS